MAFKISIIRYNDANFLRVDMVWYILPPFIRCEYVKPNNTVTFQKTIVLKDAFKQSV